MKSPPAISTLRRPPAPPERRRPPALAGIAGVLLTLAAGLSAAGCVDLAEAAGEAGKPHVGIVFDSGGKDDRSFNAAAFRGVTRAAKDFPIVLRDAEPGDPASLEPAMRAFAEVHYDLVIGIGFAQTPIVEAVAQDYPEVRFAIVDGVSNLPNVASLIFKEHEGSFLVGMAARPRRAESSLRRGLSPLTTSSPPATRKARRVNPAHVIKNYVGVPRRVEQPRKGKDLALASTQGPSVFRRRRNSGSASRRPRAGGASSSSRLQPDWVKPGRANSIVKRATTPLQIIADWGTASRGRIHVYAETRHRLRHDHYNET